MRSCSDNCMPQRYIGGRTERWLVALTFVGLQLQPQRKKSMGLFKLNFILCAALIGASTFGELSASIQDSLDVKGQLIPLVLLAEAPVSVGT